MATSGEREVPTCAGTTRGCRNDGGGRPRRTPNPDTNPSRERPRPRYPHPMEHTSARHDRTAGPPAVIHTMRCPARLTTAAERLRRHSRLGCFGKKDFDLYLKLTTAATNQMRKQPPRQPAREVTERLPDESASLGCSRPKMRQASAARWAVAAPTRRRRVRPASPPALPPPGRVPPRARTWRGSWPSSPARPPPPARP